MTTLDKLARRQSVMERTPCGRCALDAVLDYLVALNGGPGHHALLCDRWHAGSPCPTCRTLTRYGHRRGLPTGSYYERVALLLPGELTYRGDYRYAGEMVARSLDPCGRQDVSQTLWELALSLGTHQAGRLTGALALAATLVAAPTQT